MTLPKLAHPGWADCPAFQQIRKIADQLSPGTYYPEPSPLTFRAFEMNPLDIKVVLMGMSPYPSYNEHTRESNACGYAFAIDNYNLEYRYWPASLRIIYTDIMNFESGMLDPTLKPWRDKGVFLLNAALTCVKESPESHIDLWKPFMSELVKWLSDQPGQRIWYFMGDTAKRYKSLLAPLKDVYFEGMHPARAARTGEVFDGKFAGLKKMYKTIYNDELQYLSA